MFTTIVGWVLFGLVIGVVARLLHPGYDAIGWAGTILLGIMGSLLGGGIAYLLGYGTSPTQAAGWVLSFLSALALLSLGAIMGRRRQLV